MKKILLTISLVVGLMLVSSTLSPVWALTAKVTGGKLVPLTDLQKEDVLNFILRTHPISATVSSMTPDGLFFDTVGPSVSLHWTPTAYDRSFQITVPRVLLDPNPPGNIPCNLNCADNNFLVLINGAECLPCVQSGDPLNKTVQGTLPAGSDNIEIVGAHFPIVDQMVGVVVLKDGGTKATVTESESAPGQLLFCLSGAVQGPITGAKISVVRGDGSFSGGPADSQVLPWGTVVMFHGDPSANKEMMLKTMYTVH